MNKKMLRKLTLSAVTLGVAALSVTTSTFAWFTTNGEATASKVSGTVKASDVTMLIKSPTGWNGTNPVYNGSYYWDETASSMASTTSGSARTFGTSTELVNESGNGDTTTKLTPLAISSFDLSSSGPSFTKYASTGVFTTAAESSDYLHYQVVIALNGLVSGTSYSVKMQLPTINTTKATQYLLVDAGTGATAGSTIQLEISDALSLCIKNTIISSTSKNASDYGLTNGGAITSFESTSDATGFYHAKAETDYVMTKSGNESGFTSKKGDAITYYNNVYGLPGSGGSPAAIAKPQNYEYTQGSSTTYKGEYFNASSTDSWSTSGQEKTLYTVSGTNGESFVCVTDLYFFIHGWDFQCFNAIGGLKLFADNSNTITFKCDPVSNSK